MRTLLISLAVLLGACSSGGPSAEAPAAKKPNIVFVLLDDVRFDDVGFGGHPFVKTPNFDRIAHEGMMFDNAFASTPLCSPNRATILTGQYAHTHGIIDNVDRSAESHKLRTFPRLLHEAGYNTAFIGKWHMGIDPSARPGFDEWLSIKGQGYYFDPEVDDNGEAKKMEGYATDIFSERAAEFIRRERDAPFALYLSHKAVHPNIFQNADGSIKDIPEDHGFTPPDRLKELYAGETLPRRSNYSELGKGKKALERDVPGLDPVGAKTATPDDVILNRLRMLTAADEAFAMVLKALDETGQMDDTVVVVTSDHGYFYGEHGLFEERRLAYEETIKIPTAIRYPAVFQAGSKSEAFVESTDFAPTMLDLAGVAIPGDMQGRSLVPLADGKTPADWRDAVLIEYFSDKVWPRLVQMGYQAVRTDRWKLIHYTDLEGMDEMYDLQTDPYEQTNVIDDPAAQEERKKLQGKLEELLKASGGELARPF
ncbi:MAG: sulfatase-like hydrolase/transferase [Acidobacteria bacterium]|nr:sulfatase-like hydrolase/transferase [Acidobacteriota bacterium]